MARTETNIDSKNINLYLSSIRKITKNRGIDVMTGFAPKYFLIIFGLLFVAYYPIAIGMALYVGGLYWLFSKDNPIFGCIWAGLGCYISAFVVHNLIQVIS